MKMLELLMVPTVVFLAVVAPIWIIMHYHSLRRSSRSLSQNDLQLLEQMLVDVDKMSRRIEALESILEQDDPQWRRHVDPAGDEEQPREDRP